MATPNPLEKTHSESPAPISEKTFHIAGILAVVHGLAELAPSCKSVSVLWLLHGRLGSKDDMASTANKCINDWNQRPSSDRKVGLIAVAFDQRNHGRREVQRAANQTWRDGNVRHAQDMFSIFHGTALDTSLLIDHLGSYVFHAADAPSIDQHLVLGVSLGGHAAWQVFFNEPRVTAAVVIIGCPDYIRVMTDRARLSKLETYKSSNGAEFLGSKDFPTALISSIQKWDPRGLLFGASEINPNPSEKEQARLGKILDSKIKGKQILVCSGGDDKLVPYHCAEPFMKFLNNATTGWYKGGNVYVEDNVYPGIGHAYSEGMVNDTTRFVSDILAGTPIKPTSKM
ncbi:uncharacterized protein K444DRAFT_615508 [Hyaloscypha bicolor E]|uniref:Alpha/beta-hydrolase n=1 Tax=Hyaloscypha bicolor E TaxID=1095630 RepID=A0A2J6T207_9HELO|nr:uncharacterized protein K444DRAFT_615508 [Hyaloscypha bicolor E]PMD57056.1 hypothetical protein K444DRAFT_615508 [Hyaloscypha bicolor E]